MPAKRKTQKEDILKASISIISHEGLNALMPERLQRNWAVQHNHFFIFMRIWMF